MYICPGCQRSPLQPRVRVPSRLWSVGWGAGTEIDSPSVLCGVGCGREGEGLRLTFASPPPAVVCGVGCGSMGRCPSPPIVGVVWRCI